MRTISAILLTTILLTSTKWSHAGCPKVFVANHAKAAVILQQAYVPQYYAVGQHVQQEALIEAAVSRALAKFQATVTRTTMTTQTHVAGQAEATVQAHGQFSRCTKCHSGESAKGSFRVDAELSCEDRLRAISAMLNDDESKRMPKGAALSADELGLLIQTFSKRGE